MCGELWNQGFPRLLALIKTYWNKNNDFSKTLDYEFRMNSWGSVIRAGKEERNNILQKAIMLYLGELKNTFEMKNSKLSFMAIQEKTTVDENYRVVYGSTVEQLKAYSINTLPEEDQWIEIRPGLFFMQQTITEDKNGEGEKKGPDIKKN